MLKKGNTAEMIASMKDVSLENFPNNFVIAVPELLMTVLKRFGSWSHQSLLSDPGKPEKLIDFHKQGDLKLT